MVDGKPEVDGYRNLLVGCNFAKDKSETERTQSMEVLNIAMNLWFKRHSKIHLAVHPPYEADRDQSAEWNAMPKHRQSHQSLALVMIFMEACAKYGIHCTSQYIPSTLQTL